MRGRMRRILLQLADGRVPCKDAMSSRAMSRGETAFLRDK